MENKGGKLVDLLIRKPPSSVKKPRKKTKDIINKKTS